MFYVIYFAFIALTFVARSEKLPAYIAPCNSKDPKFNECATNSANGAFANIVKGDKTFHIPKMTPLTLPKVEIIPGEHLKLILKNVVVDGLETGKVKMSVSEDRKQWTTEVSFSKFDVNAQYDIDGKIAVLPIMGSGDCEIKFDSPVFTYVGNLDKASKKGVEHLKIKSSTLTHTSNRVHYQFNNLFNGDKRLGDEMNRFLNENWKDLDKDIGRSFDEIVRSIVDKTISAIVDRVPANELILDN